MTPTNSGCAPPPAPLSSSRSPSPRGEDGFSVVEVMMAMIILLVAVLGTTVLIQGGLRSTQQTSAREQGTSLARDLVERSRQVAYAQMSMANAPSALRAVLPSTDEASGLAGSTFEVRRRNITYEVDVFACSIDDPTDGAGVGDSTFCAASPTTPPGSGVAVPAQTAAPAAQVNVLGVEVALGGSLLGTVCSALGNPELFARVSSAASTLAPVAVCPEGAGTTNVNFDTQPDDLRRVRISVTWEQDGDEESLTQTTLLPNPVA